MADTIIIGDGPAKNSKLVKSPIPLGTGVLVSAIKFKRFKLST